LFATTPTVRPSSRPQLDAGGVQDAVDQRVHVVGPPGRVGQQRSEINVGQVHLVGRVVAVVVAQERHQLARGRQRLRVGGGDDVHDAGPAAVRL
jgi:hypothetical protein